MFAIDDATAVAVMPTPEAAGTPGFFTEGNPALGAAATYLRASFLNALQQELLNLLAGAGVTPSKTVYDQLLTALRSNALITGNATGAANTYAVAYTPAITTLVDGMVLWFKASATNTGASTLNINAMGAKPIVGGAHLALQGGEIIANGRCLVVWNAALNSWVLIECTGAALQVAAATQSQHALQLGQAIGRLLNIQVITSSGTYTPTAGTTSIVVEGVGGGGGGGGCPATGAGQQATAQGGISGTYGKARFTSGFSGGVSVTIGAAGAGGSTGTNAGVAGGNTTFGSLATFQGGAGGAGGAATSSTLSATGNSGDTNVPVISGGTLLQSQSGRTGPGAIVIGTATGQVYGGGGGDSVFGRGGVQVTTSSGLAGSGRGAGGSGCAQSASNAGSPGGAGTAGVIVVWEYA